MCVHKEQEARRAQQEWDLHAVQSVLLLVTAFELCHALGESIGDWTGDWESQANTDEGRAGPVYGDRNGGGKKELRCCD